MAERCIGNILITHGIERKFLVGVGCSKLDISGEYPRRESMSNTTAIIEVLAVRRNVGFNRVVAVQSADVTRARSEIPASRFDVSIRQDSKHGKNGSEVDSHVKTTPVRY